MVPDVAVPSYDQAYGGLGAVYDPQVSSVNTQIADLPRQQQAVQASLDQAKVNAFKDITAGSNARGVLFSGVPVDQQATYVGTKYLPAVANNVTSFNNTKTTLLDKINAINAQRASQAQGIVSSAQTASQNAAYKNATLALSAQRASTSSSKAAASAASKLAGQFKVAKFGSGNYKFTGPNGTPTNLAGFLDGSGGGVDDLKSLLANGSSYDKNIYNQVKGLNDPSQIAAAVAKLDKQNFYGFR